MRPLLCLPSWHAGPQLPICVLHRCKVQPFTWCQVAGLTVPPPKTVSAIALCSPIPNVLQNVCIFRHIDMLIYCFLVFQHILYYRSQADAAKVPFIWVVLLSGLHTVTLTSAKIWTQLMVVFCFICLLVLFCFVFSFCLLMFQAHILAEVKKASRIGRPSVGMGISCWDKSRQRGFNMMLIFSGLNQQLSLLLKLVWWLWESSWCSPPKVLSKIPSFSK